MLNNLPPFSVCPESGALVFKKPPLVKKQEETEKATQELKAENQLLKSVLAELVAAQSQSVKSKLSPELVEALTEKPVEPQPE